MYKPTEALLDEARRVRLAAEVSMFVVLWRIVVMVDRRQRERSKKRGDERVSNAPRTQSDPFKQATK